MWLMDSFKHIIECWPTRAALAVEVGAAPLSVRAWHHRNSIPAEYWLRVVTAAKARGFKGITYEAMLALADKKLPPMTQDDAA